MKKERGSLNKPLSGCFLKGQHRKSEGEVHGHFDDAAAADGVTDYAKLVARFSWIGVELVGAVRR
jgi:hypothetical protein